MNILIPIFTGIGNFILKKDVINELISDGYNISFATFSGNPVNELIDKEHKLIYFDNGSLSRVVFFIKNRNIYNACFLFFDSSPGWFFLLSIFFLRNCKVFSSCNFHNHSLKVVIKYLLTALSFRKIFWVPLVIGRHEKEINYDFYTYLKLESDRISFIKNKFISLTSDFSKLDVQKYIIIQPTSANGAHTCKNWLPENWLILLQLISNQYPDLLIFIVGDEGDLSGKFKLDISNPNILDIRGKTSLLQIIDLIHNSSLVITADSGVMHLADSLSANLIALYGPTDYTRTRPTGRHSSVIFSFHESFLALYDFNNTESKLASRYPNFECMSLITADHVMQLVKKCLSD